MKTIGMEQTTLDACLQEAQRERVVITRDGAPVALIVGLEGIDEEQVQLGTSDTFWTLIAERRRQGTLDRSTLEREGRSSERRGQRLFLMKSFPPLRLHATPEEGMGPGIPERATLADLARTEGQAELIGGRIVTSPPFGYRPARVASQIQLALHEFAEAAGRGEAFTATLGCVIPELRSGRQSFCADAP